MNEAFIPYFVIPAIPVLVVTSGLVTLDAIVGYVAARQVHPISFLKSPGRLGLGDDGPEAVLNLAVRLIA